MSVFRKDNDGRYFVLKLGLRWWVVIGRNS
jgi:hypothetical protein